MSSYAGRLWLVPDRETTLGVEIHLDEASIKITSNGTVIGEWKMSDVVVREIGPDSVRLVIEGEEVIVSSHDPEFMPALVGPTERTGKHAELVVNPTRFDSEAGREAWSFARDVGDPVPTPSLSGAGEPRNGEARRGTRHWDSRTDGDAHVSVGQMSGKR